LGTYILNLIQGGKKEEYIYVTMYRLGKRGEEQGARHCRRRGQQSRGRGGNVRRQWRKVLGSGQTELCWLKGKTGGH